jgi:hypothetical protein
LKGEEQLENACHQSESDTTFYPGLAMDNNASLGLAPGSRLHRMDPAIPALEVASNVSSASSKIHFLHFTTSSQMSQTYQREYTEASRGNY